MNAVQIKQLNVMYGDFLKQKHEPLKLEIHGDLSTLNKTDNAVILDKSYGTLNEFRVLPIDTNVDSAVIRYVIPSWLGNKLMTYNDGLFYLSIIKNQMLCKLKEHFNSDDFELPIFQLPENPDHFFRSLSDEEGLELRAYIKRKETSNETK